MPPSRAVSIRCLQVMFIASLMVKNIAHVGVKRNDAAFATKWLETRLRDVT
jgi:hypothetical protein